MTEAERRRILLPLCGLALLLVLLPALLLTGTTRSTKSEIATEYLSRQATAVAAEFAAELLRAAAAGIPLDRIPRMGGYLRTLLQQYPSLQFIALLSPDGQVVEASGQPLPSPDRLLHYAAMGIPAAAPSGDGSPTAVLLSRGDHPVLRFTMTTPAGVMALVYGVMPADGDPAVLSQGLRMLCLMLALLVLLGLPILYDALSRILFRPADELEWYFAEAAQGRFRFLPAGDTRVEFRSIVRLWNNEVLSLQERHNQFESFAQDAVGASDEPAVTREIERLARSTFCPVQADPAPVGTVAGFGPEARLPALMLAFLAIAAYGNWPGPETAATCAAGGLAGLLAGWLLAARRVQLAHSLLRAGCLTFAVVMLAIAIAPYLQPQDSLAGAAWAVPNALLLGMLAGAALRRPSAMPAGAGRQAGDGRRTVRRESGLLLLHLLAGLLAALIWNIGELSPVDDTLEAAIAALVLPIVAALLRARR